MAEQTKSLEELIKELPPDMKEQVREYAQSLLEGNRLPARRLRSRFTWAGGLKEYRDQYTSLELQKKALDWWGD